MSAWFIGYTPQLVTAVTLYNTDEAGNPVPIPGFGGRNEITGGSFPCRIWTSYMKEALQDTEELDFADPAWVGKSTGGRPSSSSSSSSRSSDDTETDTPTETGSATDSPSSEPSSPSSSSSSSSSSSTSPPGGSETSAPGG
jgi:membrane peptidoglycan carboxypeptidase